MPRQYRSLTQTFRTLPLIYVARLFKYCQSTPTVRSFIQPPPSTAPPTFSSLFLYFSASRLSLIKVLSILNALLSSLSLWHCIWPSTYYLVSLVCRYPIPTTLINRTQTLYVNMTNFLNKIGPIQLKRVFER